MFKQEPNQCGCYPRILVVDDNQYNILALKTMIEELFHLEVEEACNGKVAL
jgi:CheY-like chemotaxis protein